MNRAARRGPWLPDEDRVLLHLVQTQGPDNWVRISQQLQHRSAKQCRERYHQNLKPSLKHEPISAHEGEIIEQMVGEMGKRWAEIARHLGNRSDNAVKNWWNGSMNRRRRNPTQPSTGFKRMGSRTQPIPATNSNKTRSASGAVVPLYRATHVPTHAPTSQYHIQPPSAPSASFHDSADPSPYNGGHSNANPQSSRFEHRPILPTPLRSQRRHSKVSSIATTTYSPEKSFPNPGISRSQTYEDLAHPTSLPLATFAKHQARRGSAIELPLISPALSETTQMTRKPPSLISDNLSSCSMSPKTITSPYPHMLSGPDGPNKPWYHHSANGATRPTASDTNEVAEQGWQPRHPSLRHSYSDSRAPNRGKDNRMQLSSLLG